MTACSKVTRSQEMIKTGSLRQSLSPRTPRVESDLPERHVYSSYMVIKRSAYFHLQLLENFIQMNIKTEMAHIQQNVVQNQTAAILEIGTNLLSQTAEQTRKLTDVETQVLNQTSRIEIQLLENSLSTNKLERQLLVQTSEIHKLQDQNR
ncbi:angiopoietin-1-like [Pantherophis guttatus]|uniref:Angiopoietin-1-like n=1 Tax=Pantherophis guttatus TaxID=94885 RepID=A0ABM3ZBE5_PANGU|nr:angiopoietin-1-like [Pantherophis guttatus]